MDGKTVANRMMAAQEILQKGTIDASTFSSLKALLSGINPRLDAALNAAEKAVKKVGHLQKGDVIDLALDSLPEYSLEDKKRKKAILFFLKFWKDLKVEVDRVEKELGGNFHKKSLGDKAGAIAGIFSAAKGPLGVITFIAIGVVALKMTEVTIVIKNIGCESMQPASSVAINIPGLMLPSQTLPPGGEVTAKLPPLTARVDATAADVVRLSVYGVRYSFDTGSSAKQYIFDGSSLNGVVAELHLGDQKQHTLEIHCR